jgi:hypothetical protein
MARVAGGRFGSLDGSRLKLFDLILKPGDSAAVRVELCRLRKLTFGDFLIERAVRPAGRG